MMKRRWILIAALPLLLSVSAPCIITAAAPVRVLEKSLLLGDAPQLTVQNQNDTGTLAGYYFQLSWRDGKDGAEIGGETIPLPAVPPHGRAPLALRVKDFYAVDASHLHITIRNASHELVGRIGLPVHAPQSEPSVKLPPPRVEEIGEQWRLSANGTTLTLDRHRGLFLSLRKGDGLINLFGPIMDASESSGRLSTQDTPRYTLVETIQNEREVGGIWRVDAGYSLSGWPDYVRFRSAYRITMEADGTCALYYTHTYLGRRPLPLMRWGTAVGVRAPRRLIYHGRASRADILGVQDVPLAPGRSMTGMADVAALLAMPSSTEGVAVIGDHSLDLAVQVDAQGRATFALSPLRQVDAGSIRTCSGAIRLAWEGGQWWKRPAPAPWPECDDGDALSMEIEAASRTSPLLADTDGDGPSDSKDPAPLDADVPRLRMPDSAELAAMAESERRGEGWVWIEGEAHAYARGAVVDASETATTSRGACLSGWRREGDTALYAFRLAGGIESASLALRYACTQPSAWLVHVSHPGGVEEQRVPLAPTFIENSTTTWALAPVWIGDIKPGVVFVELIAPVAGPPVKLDGFYLTRPTLTLTPSLAGNIAPPPEN